MCDGADDLISEGMVVWQMHSAGHCDELEECQYCDELCHCGELIKDHKGLSHGHSPVPMRGNNGKDD